MGGQPGIAAPVILERRPGCVEGKSIDFHYELLASPEEVDLVIAHAHIGFRRGELCVADQDQELFFGLGSRPRRPRVALEQCAQ